MSLPSNWASASILTCGTFIRGVTYKKQEASTTKKPGYTRLLRANNISNRNINTEEIVYVPLHNISETQILQSGDILIATSSGSPSVVGKAAQIKNDTDMSFGAFCGVIRPYKDLNPEYIGHFFSSKQYRDRISKLARGTNINNIKQEHFESIKIPLPPINEQRRIADKLDRVLARVDAANEHLSRVAPLIKRFRQSVLAAAFKGKLTEEFRKQEELTPIYETVKRSPEIPRPNRYNSRTDAVIPGDFALSVNQSNMIAPDGWKWLPMVDVARMESGHTPSRSFPEYWHGNIPWIGIVDARLHHTSTIEDTIQHTNNLGLENSAARLLPEGTVCVSRTASVGYVVKMGKPMATSQDFVNWVCGPAVSPDWLKWLFVAEGAALYRFGKGSTHTTIYFPEWLSLHVALPPLEEQSEIVRRVEKLFAFADHLEERLSQAQAAVQKLTPALLAKAFRGELVPQDPNDEPASELLKRLQESRANDIKPRRAR